MANPRLRNPFDSTRFSSLIPQRPRFFVFLVVTLASSSVETRASIRPEIVLLNALAKPFEPTKWSSPECQRDSAIYLEELARYTPWALKSEFKSCLPVALFDHFASIDFLGKVFDYFYVY